MRAVRAGLGMVEAMRSLNARLERERSVRLAIRVGIHTGLVVVGEIGGGSRREHLALGDAPILAARLQGMAAPDTILISDATEHLVHGFFHVRALGASPLKGIAEPVPVYGILGETGAGGRLDAAAARGLTPLVGREQEAALLLERWRQAVAGAMQVVVLSGEPGIGKSRLIQVLGERLHGEAL
ncbi:MAG: adenylate/guanylate cyclase domain-containing protein [Dehalococcoidia bacterium]